MGEVFGALYWLAHCENLFIILIEKDVPVLASWAAEARTPLSREGASSRMSGCCCRHRDRLNCFSGTAINQSVARVKLEHSTSKSPEGRGPRDEILGWPQSRRGCAW